MMEDYLREEEFGEEHHHSKKKKKREGYHGHESHMMRTLFG